MQLNDFKTALRSPKRRRACNLINLLGRSLAIACMIFISCLARKEADGYEDMVVSNSMGMVTRPIPCLVHVAGTVAACRTS